MEDLWESLRAIPERDLPYQRTAGGARPEAGRSRSRRADGHFDWVSV